MFAEKFEAFGTHSGSPARRQQVGWIVGALCIVFGLDQLLLWRFLDLVPAWSYAAGAAAVAGIAAVVARAQTPPSGHEPRFAAIAICLTVAAVVFLLGGEGRLFYATTDWQVRGAVLRDLVLYPWPYVYAVGPEPDLLRAPLGMYLAPAVLGKAAGVRCAEWALLTQNAGLFAALLALGARLFPDRKQRWRALGIFLGFSGLDAIGQTLAGQPVWMNAERWDVAIFSSHITQAFWVPQHGLTGWIGAALYLLWRDGKLPLVAFLTPLPMLALWSPLALLGTIPFATHAAFETLARRKLQSRDIVLPAITTLLALPSLIYLISGSGAVGASFATIPLHQYLAFETIEVGPYLTALWCIGRSGRFGGATLAIVTAVLLIIPLGQVGTSSDLVMRGSIPALAILAVTTADVLGGPPSRRDRFWRRVLMISLAIGLVTPGFEIWRAVTLPKAPEILCSYFGVVPGGASTYVTPLDHVARAIRPRSPALIKPDDPAQCWSGPWPEPIL